MKSTVERLSPTRVRFNVEVPFDELKPDFDRAYKSLANQIQVKGFRKGKVPARVIEARIGRGPILDEVVNAAIPRRYEEAVTSSEEKLQPLGRPEIEVTELADGERLAFTAEVDVRPEITLPDLSSISVTVDPVEVSDEDVTEQLDNLRARFGTLTGVDRPAQKDDFVLIDLSASVDGKPVEEAQTSGFSYQVGQGGLVEGIDEAIIGLSAGEERVFTTKLVAGEFAGRDADVTVKVTAVKERHLPEADDEFAQLASEFDTLEELTEDLRNRLARVKRMEQVGSARDKVLDAIVEATDVPLPEGIVQAEVDAALHDAVHPFDHDEEKWVAALEAQGTTREEWDRKTREAAEKSVRSRLILDALADANDVTVSEQELSERIVFQASQYGMPPEEFVRRLQEAGQLGVLYADARRSKALIQAVRQATVVDTAGAPVDLSEFLGPDEDAPGSSTESSTEASTEAAAEDSSDDAAQAPAASGTAS
ncbi:trigger factor [Pseudonocardia thermophila]|uniref:trigger factor n=1 Tax=Pseudonocardia thermophila TaxID=1848 RepID=UPI00248F079D|nr:trigger factor [Pseudonocardia thermophila]